MKKRGKKYLIFRLSSLGDVVLSSAVLGSEFLRDAQVDWVTSVEFAPLIESHPKVSRVWDFDRKSGFTAWIDLVKVLWRQEYDGVFDLHSSLRTRIAQVLFFVWGKRNGRPAFFKQIKKPRLRRLGFFMFKNLWPKVVRPPSMRALFSKCVYSKSLLSPCLNHLIDDEERVSPPYICVMPDASHPSKRWPLDRYLDVIRELGKKVVVLGTGRDEFSLKLVEKLKENKLDFVSGVGQWNLVQVTNVIHGAELLISSETGLAHIGQSVGTPTWVVYGPTHPDLGFGVWGPQTKSFLSNLGCQPCGKDGRYCFRMKRRYACLTEYSSRDMVESAKAFMKESTGKCKTKPLPQTRL